MFYLDSFDVNWRYPHPSGCIISELIWDGFRKHVELSYIPRHFKTFRDISRQMRPWGQSGQADDRLTAVSTAADTWPLAWATLFHLLVRIFLVGPFVVFCGVWNLATFRDISRHRDLEIRDLICRAVWSVRISVLPSLRPFWAAGCISTAEFVSNSISVSIKFGDISRHFETFEAPYGRQNTTWSPWRWQGCQEGYHTCRMLLEWVKKLHWAR